MSDSQIGTHLHLYADSESGFVNRENFADELTRRVSFICISFFGVLARCASIYSSEI